MSGEANTAELRPWPRPVTGMDAASSNVIFDGNFCSWVRVRIPPIATDGFHLQHRVCVSEDALLEPPVLAVIGHTLVQPAQRDLVGCP